MKKVFSKAYCNFCATFHEPHELTQSWRADDTQMCPNCHTPIPDDYIP